MGKRLLKVMAILGLLLGAGCSSKAPSRPPDGGVDGSLVDASTDSATDGHVREIKDCTTTDAEQWTGAAVDGMHCQPQDRMGVIEVTRTSPGEWAVTGSMMDSVDPQLGPPTMAVDDCELFEPTAIGPCECEGAEICVGERCVRPPQGVPSPRLRVGGEGGDPVILTGDVTGHVGGLVTVPGDAVSLRLTGCAISVTLAAVTAAPLLTNLSGTLEGGWEAPEAVDISWDIPVPGYTVHARQNVNHHSGNGSFAECFVPAENGALRMAGSILGPLSVHTGLEFQQNTINHYRIAAAETPYGCIEFRLRGGINEINLDQ